MKATRRSADPLWWLLFSAGGVVAAFLFPVTIVLTGVAIPAGLIDETELLELVRHPVGRLYLFLLISFPLFHWAHRFRYALIDLGLVRLGEIKLLFYGSGAAGTLLAGWLLLRL